MSRIEVLRWGHRPRDYRLTTHVALTARALGASGIILADVEDKGVERSIKKVVAQWGGPFSFKMGIPWRKAIKEWRAKGGIIVHLTAYGENINGNLMRRIKLRRGDVMVIVGSRKVPRAFYSKEVSDFNVAVGNQPHSECSSLAVFLDRYFNGKEVTWCFKNAKVSLIPKPRGKKLIRLQKFHES